MEELKKIEKERTWKIFKWVTPLATVKFYFYLANFTKVCDVFKELF